MPNAVPVAATGLPSLTATRRTILAGLAGAPIAGLPTIAGPSCDLAAAIAHHQATVAVVQMHCGPEDLPVEFVADEDTALHKIAALPCDDPTLLTKLRYMVADQKRRYGGFWHSSDAGEIMIALELHFCGEITA